MYLLPPARCLDVPANQPLRCVVCRCALLVVVLVVKEGVAEQKVTRTKSRTFLLVAGGLSGPSLFPSAAPPLCSRWRSSRTAASRWWTCTSTTPSRRRTSARFTSRSSTTSRIRLSSYGSYRVKNSRRKICPARVIRTCALRYCRTRSTDSRQRSSGVR